MPENNIDTLSATPFWQWPVDSATIDAGYTGIPFDSIHPLRELPDTVFRESLVVGHKLPPHHDNLVVRPDTAVPTWNFVILLLIISLSSLYMKLRKIKFIALLKAAVDLRAMDRLVRDCNLKRNTLMLPMGLLLVASVSMVIHASVFAQSGILGYLATFGLLGLLYILRNLLLRMLGNTFDNKKGISLYITCNYIHNLLEGLLVTVLLLPFLYFPGAQMTMTYIISIALAIIFLWRFARGVKVFLTNQNHSSFYLFYYLCIVEAIPILAIIKWLLSVDQ